MNFQPPETYEVAIVANFDNEQPPLFTKTIPAKLLLESKMISDMLEICNDSGNNPLPLPANIIKSERHLDLLLEYLEFMISPEYPQDRPEEDIPNDLTDWEKEYMNKLDMDTHYDLIQICNFLHIPRFQEALCFWAACNPNYGIKGKTPQQLREQFGIINDLTPAEVEQIHRENQVPDDD